MRIALAQINATVGDIAGNEAKVREQLARAREAGAQLVALPRAGGHRLPARGPAAQGALPRRRARGGRADRGRRARASSRVVGFPERADDVYNAAAVLADGARPGDLPQGQPAQLRRLRRAALLPARRRAGRSIEVDGVKVGLTICEDIWVPGRADDRRGAGRRAAGRSTSPPRPTSAGKGRRARADDRPARARQPRGGRLLRARRRPGRAGLRRPLVRRRPRRRRDRPRAAVRRGAAGLRRRRRGGRRGAPARHARAAGGARGRARGRRPRLVLDRGRLATRRRRAARSPSCSTPTPRSTRRSCSARATT